MNNAQPVRLSFMAITAVALFAALLSRLWYLQVMTAPEYQEQALGNRIRSVVVEGPRGRILDRNGVVLAGNRESVVVTVDQAGLKTADDTNAVLAKLATELRAGGTEITTDEIKSRIDKWQGDPFRPIVVASDVNPELYYTLAEHSFDMPGVGVEKRLVRTYPEGQLAAHVLGYIGEISQEELDDRVDAEKSYRLGDKIGKAGIEQQYEAQLRGTPGRIVFEVNSMNRIVAIVDRVEPESGDDVWLSIDADLQKITEVALEEEMSRSRSSSSPNGFPASTPAGAAVVEDATNGQVLAMASYPTFDPNELIGGISAERYEELTAKEFYRPLSNRAIREPYAPGSTFKIFSGYAAASTGLRAPGFTINDTGSYTLKPCDGDRCTFYNAGKAPHGAVDLRMALTVSSNVYFFGVGEGFARKTSTYGERAIQDVAASFGLGSRTGVALPLELGGILIDPEMKRQRHEDNPEAFPEGRWNIGDTVNLAIGQGDVGITPIQLANAYAAMGNGGTLFAPNIALRITSSQTGEELQSFGTREIRQLDLDEDVRQAITDGLVGATSHSLGTSAKVFAGFPHSAFPVAGKTGTAQVYGKASSSIYAAWAPAADPKFALSVFVEEGGYGATVAAPIARRILEPLAMREINGTSLNPEHKLEVPTGGGLD
ncbi:MAG: penicillin-binding protein 2 [Acidimicrobiia bacterium]